MTRSLTCDRSVQRFIVVDPHLMNEKRIVPLHPATPIQTLRRRKVFHARVGCKTSDASGPVHVLRGSGGMADLIVP